MPEISSPAELPWEPIIVVEESWVHVRCMKRVHVSRSLRGFCFFLQAGTAQSRRRWNPTSQHASGSQE